jgi:hypothetical protein
VLDFYCFLSIRRGPCSRPRVCHSFSSSCERCKLSSAGHRGDRTGVNAFCTPAVLDDRRSCLACVCLDKETGYGTLLRVLSVRYASSLLSSKANSSPSSLSRRWLYPPSPLSFSKGQFSYLKITLSMSGRHSQGTARSANSTKSPL